MVTNVGLELYNSLLVRGNGGPRAGRPELEGSVSQLTFDSSRCAAGPRYSVGARLHAAGGERGVAAVANRRMHTVVVLLMISKHVLFASCRLSRRGSSRPRTLWQRLSRGTS